MNRWGFRALGIALGLVVGTAVAVVTVGMRKAQRERELAKTELDESSDALHSLPSDDSEGHASVAPVDVGRRRQLQELIEATASEPKWTRNFELTERSGQTIRSEELRGQPYVVCFFFTTCPGTCKRQSGEMRLLQSKFKGRPIRLVSISVDPEVDTPEVLREYAESFGADPQQWLFLTGDLENIIRIGTEMFYLPAVERRGHPDRFCLVDAEGKLVGAYEWKNREEVAALIAHVEEVLSESKSDQASGAR
ncbi:MAG: SCO family protein [Pirellula sp.]